MRIKILFSIIVIALLSACSSDSTKQSEKESEPLESSSDDLGNSIENSVSSYHYYDSRAETEEEVDEDEDIDYVGDCELSDGTYSATVYYNNSETNYSATYTLDVEVQDCQVVQIYFNNGGYLDEDHISYADIDQYGYAYVYGEGGKSYEVQIDI